MKGRGDEEVKCKEREEKVSRRQPRKAVEIGRDKKRGGDPKGVSSPTSIMEERSRFLPL